MTTRDKKLSKRRETARHTRLNDRPSKTRQQISPRPTKLRRAERDRMADRRIDMSHKATCRTLPLKNVSSW